MKEVKDSFSTLTLVNPERTYSPDLVLPALSGFENISRSQEPPSLRDIDLKGSRRRQLLRLCLKAVGVTLVTIHDGHDCPSPRAHCGTRRWLLGENFGALVEELACLCCKTVVRTVVLS